MAQSRGDSGTGPKAGFVLLVLASAQFLMTLDSSVMNVSIQYVAKDLNTTVTGIQTAITLYTLVMASFMITGGKIGARLGRRRTLAIGLIVYGVGSAVTAAAPNLGFLLLGWSLFEGLGAALILPAIVALVAVNFAEERRPSAYGLIAAASAIAIAAGPLVGGAVTTFASWRYVFVAEVVIVFVILLALRKVADQPVGSFGRFDFAGAALSIVGLASTVFGVLRSSQWGVVSPKAGAPSWLGVSAVVWLILGGLLLTWVFFVYEGRLEKRGGDPLVRPSMLANSRLIGGLSLFFFQYLVQMGLFFVVPLYLSVVLALSAVQTGARLLPLSLALLVSAIGIPRLLPGITARTVLRSGFGAMTVGIVLLVTKIDVGAGAEIVLIPMLLIGLGIGALASQLGALTVSSVPDSASAEVGGLQNTVTNFGASLGTALAGAILIGVLSTTLITGAQSNAAIPKSVTQSATVQLSNGVPFISDAELSSKLAKTDLTPATQKAVISENEKARLAGLRVALWVLAIFSVVALFFTGLAPKRSLAALAVESSS
ncbi:MAG TPA: MFS transporter [Acidimicrobiales bacterium]|nr:MFS transporter [Acidimicrobiales bacterium]